MLLAINVPWGTQAIYFNGTIIPQKTADKRPLQIIAQEYMMAFCQRH